MLSFLKSVFDIIEYYREYDPIPESEMNKIIRKMFLEQAIDIIKKEIDVATI